VAADPSGKSVPIGTVGSGYPTKWPGHVELLDSRKQIPQQSPKNPIDPPLPDAYE
jgi:hypothetical protein